MAETQQSKPWLNTLIFFVIAIVLTVLGGYFIGTVVSKVITLITTTYRTLLVSGLVMFAVGIILLVYQVMRYFRKS